MVINLRKIIFFITILFFFKSVNLLSAYGVEGLNHSLWYHINNQYFIGHGSYEIIVNLLNRGANPNWIKQDRQNPNRETVIFGAIRRSANHDIVIANFFRSVVRLLISRGAIINFRNNNGLTPIELANQLGIPEVIA